MAIGSGLSMQLGFGEETVYGTRVAPTRFIEVRSESMQFQRDVLESQGLRATASGFPRSDRYVVHQETASGDFEAEIVSKGFGLLFKHMLGSISIITPAGGTLTRIHRAQAANLGGLSLTTQVGKPDVGGTVRPFDYPGTKFAEWEIAMGIGEHTVLTGTLDAQDEVTDQSLASASYASSVLPLTYLGGSVIVGGTPAIAADAIVAITGGTATEVRTASVARDNGLATDRWRMGATTKLEQIQAGLTPATGTIELEFNTLTDYNRFTAGTTYALLLKCQAATAIEGSFYPGINILMPAVRFDGETPTVEGPEILTMSMDYTALDNGSLAPITIDYVSSDTAS